MSDPQTSASPDVADELEGAAEAAAPETVLDEAVEDEAASQDDSATDAVEDASETAEEPAVEETSEEAAEQADEVAADASEEAEQAKEAADQAKEVAVDKAVAVQPVAKSQPKMAIGMGDLLIVGILSLIMGGLLAFAVTALAPASGAGEGSDLSGGVAATVNGVSIGENEVTSYMANLRKQQQLESDDAWGEWLVSAGYTPESARAAVIDGLVGEELVKEAVAEQEITVSDDEVDNYIAQMAEQVGGQEKLQELLSEQGVEFESYRNDVKLGLSQQLLAEKVAGDVEVTDDEVLEMLKMYGAAEEDAKSLDGIDESMVQSFREQLKSQKINEVYSAWMTERQNAAEIKIEDMPEGLPYAIDLTKYEEAAAAAAKEAAAGGDTAEAEEAEVVVEDAASSESAASSQE